MYSELVIDAFPELSIDGVDVAIDKLSQLAIDTSWLAIDLHFTWIDYMTSHIYNYVTLSIHPLIDQLLI